MTYPNLKNHQGQQEDYSNVLDEENIHCYLRTYDWQIVLDLILDIQYSIIQIENYDFSSLEANELRNVRYACELLYTLNEYNRNQKFYLSKLNPQYQYDDWNTEKISKIKAFLEEKNNNNIPNITFFKYALLNLFEDLKEEAYLIRYLETQYSKKMFSNEFSAIIKKHLKKKNRVKKWYWKVLYNIIDFFLKAI